MWRRFLLSFHLFCRQTASFLCLGSCICVWMCVNVRVCACACVRVPLLFSSICQGVYWSLPRPQLYSYKWAPLPSNQHWWLKMSNLTAHHRGLERVGWGWRWGILWVCAPARSHIVQSEQRWSFGDCGLEFGVCPLKHCIRHHSRPCSPICTPVCTCVRQVLQNY